MQEPQNQRATGLILHRHPQWRRPRNTGGRGNDRLDLSLETLCSRSMGTTTVSSS